jgi:predicted unusual protein kinase regulating ubiquinone biosynthesis (AarF/ABC1/UbiB family)
MCALNRIKNATGGQGAIIGCVCFGVVYGLAIRIVSARQQMQIAFFRKAQRPFSDTAGCDVTLPIAITMQFEWLEYSHFECWHSYCSDSEPEQLIPPPMKISTNNLKRYKEIVALLWKYGRSDLVKQMGFSDETGEMKSPEADGKSDPAQLADDLEAMGPTYVKLGQLLSSRSDLMPEPYLKALTRLQDKVKPFPYEEVEQIVLDELGVRISKAFSRFDPKPIAAASLGQVHAAALRDGREVIVKVQRPNIRKQIAEDFEVLAQIAEFLDAHTEVGRRYRFQVVLEELRVTIQQELNYEREAQNLITLGRNLEEFPHIEVPQPVPDYSTPRVLTMDYVQGVKITALSPVARLGLNGDALAEELFKAYLKQILLDGLFHADPHPGNVFLTNEGNIALLDLGMVGRIAPTMQDNLLKLLIAVGYANYETAADIVIRISKTMESFDSADFHRHIGQIMALQHNQSLEKLNTGKALMEVSRSAIDSGLWVPTELTLLGKTLLQMDELGKILAPNFDPYAAIRRNAGEIMARRVKMQFSQAGVLTSLLEMKEFITGLPTRVNRLLDGVTNAEFEVKIRSMDAKTVVEGFQKVANRITAGIILASLILGAALLMRIQTSFQLMGYPGLAILCFLAAAAGGLWLLFNIFFQDEKIKKNKKT